MIKAQKIKEEQLEKPHRYFEAVGRRKTSVARVRLFSAEGGSASGGEEEKGGIVVNGRDFFSYFPTLSLQRLAQAPIKETGLFSKIRIEAKITGGGINSQAGALCHGISRVLDKFQPTLHKTLKQRGFLTRDSRAKERRKFGLKKARKAPQWSKR